MKPCLALALLNSFNVLKRVKVLLKVINVKNGRVYKVSHHLTNMEHNSVIYKIVLIYVNISSIYFNGRLRHEMRGVHRFRLFSIDSAGYSSKNI